MFTMENNTWFSDKADRKHMKTIPFHKPEYSFRKFYPVIIEFNAGTTSRNFGYINIEAPFGSASEELRSLIRQRGKEVLNKDYTDFDSQRAASMALRVYNSIALYTYGESNIFDFRVDSYFNAYFPMFYMFTWLGSPMRMVIYLRGGAEYTVTDTCMNPLYLTYTPEGVVKDEFIGGYDHVSQGYPDALKDYAFHLYPPIDAEIVWRERDACAEKQMSYSPTLPHQMGYGKGTGGIHLEDFVNTFKNDEVGCMDLSEKQLMNYTSEPTSEITSTLNTREIQPHEIPKGSLGEYYKKTLVGFGLADKYY